ncbi:MAG: endolytic transglycosylase MltG [Patescibacteria group bacterium]|nr:endolytic transglycosylase MltG [Patescibacteria group bacterium]
MCSSKRSVSDRQEGLIRNPVAFFLTVKQQGLDGKIQAGDFRLSPSMSTAQIAENLTHGTLDVWVTIPEGKRATEIAEILSKKLSSYNSSYAIALATKEGYLFPDTYLFPADSSISKIMDIMENNFNNKYQEALKNKTANLTQQQAVILASIVEREAISPRDMQLAASVLENRLNIGMPLGSDVTLEYAIGYQPTEHTWWKKDLTADDLILNSPYNTRLNAGLPPTPISNPGLVALEAVLNPPQTDYLYYVSDSKGVLHFAKTLEEHNANVKKYMQ